MRDKTNLKNRIKGLLGIILSVCTLVSMSGMNVYAVDADSSMNTTVGPDNTSISAATGGAFTVSGISGFEGASKNNGQTAYYRNLITPAGKKYKVTSEATPTTFTPTSDASSWSGFFNTSDTPYTIYALTFEEILPNSVKFDFNGGSVSESSGPITVPDDDWDGKVVILESQPTKQGANFLGWATSSTATSAQYTSGQYTFGENETGNTVTLYAVWELVALNGGSISGPGTFKLNAGEFNYSGSFSIGDGFTYTGGSFYAPAGTYTFN